jgi:hypothetical protein
MGFLTLLQDNWFTLLQSLGILGGLLFTGFSLRIDTKVRRIGNLFEVTKQHREIWMALYSRPELKRVIESDPNLDTAPVTDEERLFVTFLMLHLATNFRAAQAGMFMLPEEIRMDIANFLSRPIPKAIWERIKSFQDRDFVEFVERHRVAG